MTEKRAPEIFAAVSKSSPPEVLAELDVILGREVEVPRRAVLAHFDVGGLVAAFGHRGVQHVGQA